MTGNDSNCAATQHSAMCNIILTSVAVFQQNDLIATAYNYYLHFIICIINLQYLILKSGFLPSSAKI